MKEVKEVEGTRWQREAREQGEEVTMTREASRGEEWTEEERKGKGKKKNKKQRNTLGEKVGKWNKKKERR